MGSGSGRPCDACGAPDAPWHGPDEAMLCEECAPEHFTEEAFAALFREVEKRKAREEADRLASAKRRKP